MLRLLRKQPEWLLLFVALATAGGALAAYHLPAVRETANALAREPQRITLHELETKGPGDNPHVIVTDFACGGHYVFEAQTRKGAPPPGSDQVVSGKAWIPLFPKAPPEGPGAGTPPTRFHVLLETSPAITSGKGFHVLSRRPSMEGLALPLPRRGLQPDVRGKLAADYPDTDFQNCRVLVQYEPHEKQDPPFFAAVLTAGAVAGLLVGLPVLAVGIVFLRARWKQVRPPAPAAGNEVA